MSEEKLTRVLRELLGVVRIARSMSEEKLARALRELLGVVRIADTASVDDARYRAAIAVAQAVLDEFDAREESR